MLNDFQKCLIFQTSEVSRIGCKTIDATHIIADVAIPNTVDLLREERERVLRAIKKERKELDESLKKYFPEEFSQRPIKEKLAKELALSKELIEEVQGKYSSEVERIADLLKQAVDLTEKRKLVSFVDPNARFGRKSEDKKFAGYKAHVVQMNFKSSPVPRPLPEVIRGQFSMLIYSD